MTPKEKALELYNYYEQLGRDFTRGVSLKEFAKLCALKVVDELIADEHLEAGDSPYWIEVKKEIERL